MFASSGWDFGFMFCRVLQLLIHLSLSLYPMLFFYFSRKRFSTSLLLTYFIFPLYFFTFPPSRVLLYTFFLVFYRKCVVVVHLLGFFNLRIHTYTHTYAITFFRVLHSMLMISGLSNQPYSFFFFFSPMLCESVWRWLSCRCVRFSSFF